GAARGRLLARGGQAIAGRKRAPGDPVAAEAGDEEHGRRESAEQPREPAERVASGARARRDARALLGGAAVKRRSRHTERLARLHTIDRRGRGYGGERGFVGE